MSSNLQPCSTQIPSKSSGALPTTRWQRQFDPTMSSESSTLIFQHYSINRTLSITCVKIYIRQTTKSLAGSPMGVNFANLRSRQIHQAFGWWISTLDKHMHYFNITIILCIRHYYHTLKESLIHCSNRKSEIHYLLIDCEWILLTFRNNHLLSSLSYCWRTTCCFDVGAGGLRIRHTSYYYLKKKTKPFRSGSTSWS
jgi:hypothetical protein